MGESWKLATEHFWLWLSLTAYVPLLNFLGACVVKRWIVEKTAGRTPTGAEKQAARRIGRYRVYLPAVALLLSLVAVLVGTSLKLMALLYLAASSLLVLLVIEFIRIRDAQPLQAGSGPGMSDDFPASNQGQRDTVARPRHRPRTRYRIASYAAALVFVASALGMGKAVLWWHNVITTPSAFNIFPAFTDQMHVGDIGDITVRDIGGGYQFSYKPAGNGPHESDLKYVNGVLNPAPAKFGGVVFLKNQLPAQPGRDAGDGQNLSHFRGKIAFEARSLDGTATVKFVIGGINWAWDVASRTKRPLPYPDTMPKRDLGTKELTGSWQEYEFDLESLGLQPENFRRVIGGFGWVMTWPSPPQPERTFTIEVRKARYLR